MKNVILKPGVHSSKRPGANILREKARQEQALTLEMIELIRRVEEQRWFLKWGFASLFDFVTQDLGYEPSSAVRKIQAARLVREISEDLTEIKIVLDKETCQKLEEFKQLMAHQNPVSAIRALSNA